MKAFSIVDAVSKTKVDLIMARDGRVALKRFRESHAMSAGMWEIHKCRGLWTASTTYGAYFIAREEGVKHES